MKGLPDPLCLWQALQKLLIGPPQVWCQVLSQLLERGGLGLESWLPGGVRGEPACLDSRFHMAALLMFQTLTDCICRHAG